MATSKSEEYILKLNEQIAGPIAKANGAMDQLNATIAREKEMLGSLEGKLASASAKLEKLGQGSDGSVSIAAIRRQQEAVAALQAQIDKQSGNVGALEGARGLAAQADAMTAAAAAAKELEAAQTAQAASAAQAAAAAEQVAAAAARQAAAIQSAAAATAAAEAKEDALAQSNAIIAESAYHAAEMERKLADQLRAAQGAASEAEKKQKELAKAAKDGKVNAGELGESLGKLPGPLGDAGAGVGRLGAGFQKLAALGPVGIVAALVVVVVALGVALVAGAIAIARWGVGLADAARSQRLLADGIAGSVAGGAQLQATITRLGSVVPQTADELRQMADGLAKTGLKGDALSKALEEAAIKAAKLKFGPDFAKEMLALPKQAERLKTNLAGTFGGLKIEGLLAGLSTLVALFDSSTASGKALKFLFEKLFQPLIDGATACIPAIERAFLTAELMALNAYIALQPYSDELKILAYIVGGLLVASFALVGVAILIAFLPLMIVIGAAVAIVYVLVKAVGLVVSAFEAAVDAPMRLGAAIAGALGGAINWLRTIDLASVASDLIQGFVNGILGSAGKVVSAVMSLGGAAVAAMKSALVSHSPSELFHEIGEDGIGEGTAQGVDASTARVEKSVASLVDPKAAKDAAKGARSGGASGGGKVVYIEKLYLGSREQWEEFRAFLRGEFEVEAMSAEPAR